MRKHLVSTVAVFFFFFFFLLVSQPSHGGGGGDPAAVPSSDLTGAFSSIFAFGASLVDTGNSLFAAAPSVPPVGHLPYGITYFRRPTGRFSDGRLVVDFLAEAFGVPLLPPYLAERSRGGRFRRGANFAFAGATTLEASYYRERGLGAGLGTNVSLADELRWFEELKPSLCGTAPECEEFFSTSLFLVGELGVNDYNVGLTLQLRLQEIRSHVPDVVDAIAAAVERLIGHGAAQLVVPGVFPVGCSAAFLSVAATVAPSNGSKNDNNDLGEHDPRTGCLSAINGLDELHNRLLRRRLEELRAKHPRARIVYADLYGAVISFAHSPKHFGFTGGALRACCGSGDGAYNFNLTATCGRPGSAACRNPATYVNWDGLHLTEAAYRFIADEMLQGRRTDPPLIN